MKSRKYDTVKKWYDIGAWNITMCSNAVVKKWITSDEFKEITGKEYVHSEEAGNGRINFTSRI